MYHIILHKKLFIVLLMLYLQTDLFSFLFFFFDSLSLNQHEGHIFSIELTPQEIPLPEFVSTKPENEWDEDEKKAYEDYEKKTIELDERKEAYKKVQFCFAMIPNMTDFGSVISMSNE